MSGGIAVNGSFLVQPITGVQRYAREAIRAFRDLDVEDLVVLAPNGYPKKEYLGYRVVRDNLPWRQHMWLWEQVRLPWLMRKSAAELLWSPCNTGPLLVRRQVVTVHDASLFANPSWFSFGARTIYRLILSALCRNVVKVLTDSEFSKRELIRYGLAPEPKISAIPCGVGAEFNTAGSPLTDDPEPREPFALCVGSRDPRKNLRRLIQAWQLVGAEKKAETKLLIAGGEARMFAEEVFDELPSDVEFVGYVSDGDLIDLYRRAEFFIYPSLYEGFGLPPLEAMASGTPVISSNAASLPEVVDGAASLVNPYEVGEIAKAIQRLFTDMPLRKELSKRGVERAQQFTWEHTARLTYEALEAARELV